MKTTLNFSLVVLLISSAVASAQFVSNFNSLNGSETLSGQDGWETNNTGQSDFVGYVGGNYSTSPTDFWAINGGLVASANSTYTPTEVNNLLWRNFAPLTGNSTISFAVKMAISSSDLGRPALDTFGWILSNSSGADVVEVRFTPSGGNLTIGWVDYTSGSSYTASSVAIPYNSQYDLEVDLTNLNSALPSLSISITDAFAVTTPVASSSLSASASNIGRVTSSWRLSDTTPGPPYTDFGYNSVIFQDLSVVPEPAAAALVVAGLAGLAAYRLRRKQD